MADINELYKDIYTVKAQMSNLSNLIDRLDTTIEKLTEVSSNISQLLAVQSNRLEHLEKMSADLSSEIDSNDRNVQGQLNHLEKEIYKEIETSHSILLSEIKQMKESNQKQLDSLNEKLAFVERWMWIVSGGAAVVGFILSKISIKFFGV